jgi:SnoaL-like domain
MADRIAISEQEAAAWLDSYKAAWEKRDVELVLSLFTENADYRERRFGEPLLGHATLQSYWQNRVFEHQRDITFDYQIWAVRGGECVATWQAAFTWLPIMGRMEIDGILCAGFDDRRDGKLVCAHFSEWMDQREVQ